jgi:hypothetical protein
MAFQVCSNLDLCIECEVSKDCGPFRICDRSICRNETCDDFLEEKGCSDSPGCIFNFKLPLQATLSFLTAWKSRLRKSLVTCLKRRGVSKSLDVFHLLNLNLGKLTLTGCDSISKICNFNDDCRAVNDKLATCVSNLLFYLLGSIK